MPSNEFAQGRFLELARNHSTNAALSGATQNIRNLALDAIFNAIHVTLSKHAYRGLSGNGLGNRMPTKNRLEAESQTKCEVRENLVIGPGRSRKVSSP